MFTKIFETTLQGLPSPYIRLGVLMIESFSQNLVIGGTIFLKERKFKFLTFLRSYSLVFDFLDFLLLVFWLQLFFTFYYNFRKSSPWWYAPLFWYICAHPMRNSRDNSSNVFFEQTHFSLVHKYLIKRNFR